MMESTAVQKLLSNLKCGEDGVYSTDFVTTEQQNEIGLRRKIAEEFKTSYMEKIAKHHSIPVMNYEVARFLKFVKPHGIVIDVGGCWGWHWRNLCQNRPDVSIIIVDFVRENLHHAAKLLEGQIGENVFLVHGDATQLPFSDNSFDGYWSVQTLQHIPNFELAVEEACRILNPGAMFASYSLNNVPWMRLIYRLFGKTYQGLISGVYFLERASAQQADIVSRIFNGKVESRFSEILFQRELCLTFSGREKSLLGKLDAKFGGHTRLWRWLARQHSYHIIKKADLVSG